MRLNSYQCATQRHARKELQSKGQRDVAELVDCEVLTSSMELEVGATAGSSSEDKGIQTDLTSGIFDQLERVVNHFTDENQNLVQKLTEKELYNDDFFRAKLTESGITLTCQTRWFC